MPDENETLMVEITTEVRRSPRGYTAECRGVAHFTGGHVTFIGHCTSSRIAAAIMGAADDVQRMLDTWVAEHNPA